MTGPASPLGDAIFLRDGYTPRSAIAKMGEIVSVKDYGAKGDGTDATAAISAALAANKNVYLPDGTYLITSTIAVPADTRLCGATKRTTQVTHGFNGDLFTLADGAGLIDLYCLGQGDTYSGKGVAISGTAGRQTVNRVRMIDFRDPCFDFTVSAGSQSSFIDVEACRWNIATHARALTGSGLYAFTISATQQLSAVPRKFLHIETNGSPAFDFGGCNDTFVQGSFLGDLNYTTDSRGVLLAGCRIANQTTLTIAGHNNTCVGCDFAPALTIDAAADHILLLGNSYNNLPITENQADVDGGNQPTNNVDFSSRTFTPAWTASVANPVLGNGTLTGRYTRIGNMVLATVNLTMGSTTTYGTGDWSLTVPVANGAAIIQVGAGHAFDLSATTNYPLAMVLATGVATVSPRSQAGAATVSSTVPFTWATGDTLRFTIAYQVI